MSPARIGVVPAASEQQSILANLLELYAHDFSEFHNIKLRADGRFGYNQLPLYWSEPGRYPFLVRVDGELAGLVLVKKGSERSGAREAWDMAEFFVARAYRRRGIGFAVAHQVWSRFPGAWEVWVMHSNKAAYHFWERAITLFTGKDARLVTLEKDGEAWHLFSFESSPGA
jgi:predicted acetyltransferase